jgi:hypothetical protein
VRLNKQVRDFSRENSNVRAFELSSGEGRILINSAQSIMASIVDYNEAKLGLRHKASDAGDYAHIMPLAFFTFGNVYVEDTPEALGSPC